MGIGALYSNMINIKSLINKKKGRSYSLQCFEFFGLIAYYVTSIKCFAYIQCFRFTD